MPPMNMPERISWPRVFMPDAGYRGGSAGMESPADPYDQRPLHAGSGTMIDEWVARFDGKTCSLPPGVHCHTPIDARKFWPASFGSSGQSKLVNLMPLPLT